MINKIIIAFMLFSCLFWIGYLVLVIRPNKQEKINKNEIKGWVARDRDGRLFFYYTAFVKKEEEIGKWVSNMGFVELDRTTFPDVKWEDQEPILVKINAQELK